MSVDILILLSKASVETLYMVFSSGFFGLLFGIPLGVLLYISKKNGLVPSELLHYAIGLIVNVGRSIPFIILVVAIIPFTRWLVGSSIGTTAMIVPLSISAIPFVARITEDALVEVQMGMVEMGIALGATAWQIIRLILFPEILPRLIQGATLTLVTLVGYSAMAGAVGGGGLGALGIQYGYQRFDATMMLLTVLILIAIVQIIQWVGHYLRSVYDH